MSTPMTADQFLHALHSEGVQTEIPYGGWTTYGRDSATGKAFGPVRGVVIHHTAGSSSLSTVHDGTGDLPGPLCHGHLPKSGVVNMISIHRANHAGSFAQNAWDAMVNEEHTHPYPDAAEPVDANDGTYGLETENLGNGSDPYPWVQYVSMVKWATAICRFHGWSGDSVIGHKEGTRRKIDPKGPVIGPDGVRFDLTMNRFRSDVNAALALPAGAWATEEEDVALTTDDINKVANAVLAKLTDGNELLSYLLTRDGVLKNPNPATAPDNPFIAVGTALNNTEIVSRRADTNVQAVQAALASLSTTGLTDAQLQELAVKVADELHNRLAG